MSIPAKINLWLEVLGRRSDGYHELSTLMLPVDVRDHLELALAVEGGIRLTCDDADLPVDGRNLAWRAAELFLATVGAEVGVDIRLKKNIPVGAGMGGGSADAAGVLLGLNRLFSSVLSMKRLAELALALGADVPFFLQGVPALATGIGERLEEVSGVPDYPLLLIKPSFSVSTKWVYQSLKLTRGASRINLRAFQACPWRLAQVMENDLESVTLHEYPLLSELKEWILERGALGALMSGSGPTVFGLFNERSQAERICTLAGEVWGDCWTAVAQVLGSPDAEPE